MWRLYDFCSRNNVISGNQFRFKKSRSTSSRLCFYLWWALAYRLHCWIGLEFIFYSPQNIVTEAESVWYEGHSSNIDPIIPRRQRSVCFYLRVWWLWTVVWHRVLCYATWCSILMTLRLEMYIKRLSNSLYQV